MKLNKKKSIFIFTLKFWCFNWVPEGPVDRIQVLLELFFEISVLGNKA